MLLIKTFRVMFGVVLVLAFTALLSGCEIKDIEIKKVSAMDITSSKGKELAGIVHMDLMNPNGYDVKVKEAHFDVMMGKVKVGEAHLGEAFKIKGETTDTYPVKINATLENILAGGISGLLNAVSGQPAVITLKGDIKASAYLITRTMPVEFKSEIPLKGLF